MRLTRQFNIEKEAWDREKREVYLSFASEEPVERYGEIEILSCIPKDVDLSRLNDGASVLENHESDDRIGGVLTASVDADRKCRAIVRISRKYAQEFFDDLEDGIPPKVSVGYERMEIVKQEKLEGGVPKNTWSWKPYEISFVAIPADNSVGIGRAKDNSTKADSAVPPEGDNKETRQEDNKMSEKQVDGIVAPAGKSAEAVRAEAAEIVKIGRQHKLESLADKALDCGMSVDEFRKQVMEELGKRNAPANEPAKDANIGLKPQEVRRYSFMNVIRALSGERVDIGFERECSAAVEKKVGRSARGIFVPFDVQSRDLQIASPGTGSNVVATNLMSGSFIEALRANLAGQKLGVTVMSGLVGDIAIPKGTTATGYWVDETTAPTESTPVLSQVTGTPKACGTYIDISRKLMKQSSIDVEAFVRNEIAIALATKIDQGIFNGGGTSEPTGLLTGPISTDVSMTAGSATYADIASIMSTVEGKNVLLERCKWAVTSEVFWKLATTATSTNGPRFIADYDTGLILGKQAIVSSNVTANYGIFGDWSQLILAMWGNGLDLNVDTSTGSSTGLTRVVGFMDVDVLVKQADAFAHADITT